MILVKQSKSPSSNILQNLKLKESIKNLHLEEK